MYAYVVHSRQHKLFTFFFQAEDGIRDGHVTGVQTCALPILSKIKTYGKNCSICNPAFVRVEIAQQKYTGINQRQLGTTKPRMQIDVQDRSEEHTSELQSRGHLVCRLLLEKKNTERREGHGRGDK